jgi:hypothetical protein
MPTHTAQPIIAAPTNHDALEFECVIFCDFVRHELNKIISLLPAPTPPPKLKIHAKCAPPPTETADSRVADLRFMRPKRHRSTHNTNALNGLNLYANKLHFLALLRPPSSFPHHPSAGKIFFNAKTPRARTFGGPAVTSVLNATPYALFPATANRFHHISSSEPRFNTRIDTSPCPDS